MREEEISFIADSANIIVCGYAFTKCEDGFISILNTPQMQKIGPLARTVRFRLQSLLPLWSICAAAGTLMSKAPIIAASD